MSNLFDYMTWRGDLSFGNAPLCPVDALIFSMLAYADFTGILPEDAAEEPIRLADAATAYLAAPQVEKSAFERNHSELLRRMAESERFGNLRLFAAQKRHDRADGIQFGALSVLLPGQNIFVAFEGTDDSLVGWKEDFRMSYECPVPAQLYAAAYTKQVAAAYPLRRLFLGGHSKGGNLAMFAGVKGDPSYRGRVRKIFNNDGPGFCDNTVGTPVYREMRGRIQIYLPESSIVAVLLEHDQGYKIVKSTNKGIAQHDGYSWQVEGADFIYTEERTAFGQKTEKILDSFLAKTSPERKRQFVEALFSILEASEQDTLSGLGKRQSIRNIIRAYTELTPEVHEMLIETLSELNRARRAASKKNAASPALTNDTREKSSG